MGELDQRTGQAGMDKGEGAEKRTEDKNAGTARKARPAAKIASRKGSPDEAAQSGNGAAGNRQQQCESTGRSRDALDRIATIAKNAKGPRASRQKEKTRDDTAPGMVLSTGLSCSLTLGDGRLLPVSQSISVNALKAEVAGSVESAGPEESAGETQSEYETDLTEVTPAPRAFAPDGQEDSSADVELRKTLTEMPVLVFGDPAGDDEDVENLENGADAGLTEDDDPPHAADAMRLGRFRSRLDRSADDASARTGSSPKRAQASRLAKRLAAGAKSNGATEDAERPSEDGAPLRPKRPGPRLPETPKWSETARSHMSSMLASGPGEISVPINAAPAGFRGERRSGSSAAMLLGLPALMFAGFAAAYGYQVMFSDHSAPDVIASSSTSTASLLRLPDGAPAGSERPASRSTIAKAAETPDARNAAGTSADTGLQSTTGAFVPLPPPVAPDTRDTAETGKVTTAKPKVETARAGSSWFESLTGKDVAEHAPGTGAVAAGRDSETQTETFIEPTSAPVTRTTNIVTEPETTASATLPVIKAEPTTRLPAARAPSGTPAAGQSAEAGPKTASGKRSAQAGNDTGPLTPDTKLAALSPAVASTFSTDANAVPQASRKNNRESQLLTKGRSLLNNGDIASARLVLELAHNKGDRQASLALAQAYDPVHFERLGVRGVRPDVGKAREWYQTAMNQGHRQAQDALVALDDWLARKGLE